MGRHLLATCVFFTLLSTYIIDCPFASEPTHGIAYFGEPRYPKGFPHFDYANPDAPKGGKISIANIGTFNNLHPFVDKGVAADGINISSMLIYDRLMYYAEDELYTAYGNLAETAEVADDRSWVEFTLREGIYWHDGVPITVEDVIWTFNTIKDIGSVGWKQSLKEVESIEQVGPRSFRFHFSEDAPKTLMLVLDQADFWPLPKHYWKNRKFNATTLDPPLGSGPYRIKSVDPGHKIVYERVEDYWGWDLNVNIGHYNFDRVEYIYFLDKNVVIQAHKARVFDFRWEGDSKSWVTSYDFDGYHHGLFKKDLRKMKIPYGMNWGIIFNTRHEKFRDIRVREALALAYNFQWSNRVLWYNQNKRNLSYFMGSDMAARGLPSAAELELLKPFRDEIPERVFSREFSLPDNVPFGPNRDSLLKAAALLEEAGLVVSDFKRVDQSTGEPFTVDFMARSVEQERMLMPYVDNLARLGIEAKVRRVESSQAINRLRKYDFEAIINDFWQNSIPLHWLIRSYFLSQNVDRPNMENFAGISNPAIDFLTEEAISAKTAEDLAVIGQALDRILLWSFFVVPGGYPVGRRMVYWDRFGYPEPTPELKTAGWHETWWFDEEKSARVDAGIAALEAQ